MDGNAVGSDAFVLCIYIRTGFLFIPLLILPHNANDSCIGLLSFLFFFESLGDSFARLG